MPESTRKLIASARRDTCGCQNAHLPAQGMIEWARRPSNPATVVSPLNSIGIFSEPVIDLIISLPCHTAGQTLLSSWCLETRYMP
ncbi:MAG: hypothetical protein MZV63_07500 [Marinilabiliales bacterium]|nr:hypothetical protein [Marinilabiliales bacterium]